MCRITQGDLWPAVKVVGGTLIHFHWLDPTCIKPAHSRKDDCACVPWKQVGWTSSDITVLLKSYSGFPAYNWGQRCHQICSSFAPSLTSSVHTLSLQPHWLWLLLYSTRLLLPQWPSTSICCPSLAAVISLQTCWWLFSLLHSGLYFTDLFLLRPSLPSELQSSSPSTHLSTLSCFVIWKHAFVRIVSLSLIWLVCWQSIALEYINSTMTAFLMEIFYNKCSIKH